MKDFREFNRNDWMAYAGAEKFKDGSQPIIAEVTFEDSRSMDIIVDIDGIEIDTFVNDPWGADIEYTSRLEVSAGKLGNKAVGTMALIIADSATTCKEAMKWLGKYMDMKFE